MSECSATSEWAHCREKCVHHLPSKSFTFEQSRAHSCGVYPRCQPVATSTSFGRQETRSHDVSVSTSAPAL